MLVTAQPPRSTPAPRRPVPAGPGSDAGLVSGEAVELDVRVARLGSRVLALLVDVLVQVGIAIVLVILGGIVTTALALAGRLDRAVTTGLQTVAVVLLLVGYPVLCETLNHGRTVGKLAVGLRVIRDDGGPVGFRQALTRTLVGVTVEWPGLVLPLLAWVAGVTTMLTDPRGRRLGDLAAGTMVVHDRSPSGFHRTVPTMLPALAGWARTLDLTRLDDGLALGVRQFVDRYPSLTGATRDRLARTLWAEVAAATSPPPPPGLPEWTYLGAVLAERHARATRRLVRNRSVTATLWPELATAASAPRPGTAAHLGAPAHGPGPATPAHGPDPWAALSPAEGRVR
ncbi:RDD family protein [Plantactinospora sp. CA-290183]|uniref:RDD family protein n=1 Tax=Plantactinospora sp. CA-290183 TaxID=3240006 RepID=UPI003D8B5F08